MQKTRGQKEIEENEKERKGKENDRGQEKKM